MAWLENNLADKLGAIETVVSRTAIIPADDPEETDATLRYLRSLILNPTELGLAGLFAKATDFISRLMYVPFKPTTSGDKKSLLITPLGNSSAINTHIPIQNIDFDKQLYTLGEYKIERHFNNFADYNGYTKIDVYLPFFGYVSVNPNDVLDKYIQIRLGFDLLSGQGTYYICVSDESINSDYATNPIANDIDFNSRILSTHTCMLCSEIPLGSTNAGDIMRNLLMGSVKVAGTALAYKSAQSSGAFVSKTKTKTITTTKKKNASTGDRLRMTGRKITEKESSNDRSQIEAYRMKSDCFGTAMSALSSMHLEAASDKPNSMMSMADGSMKVHIIIYRPRLKEEGARYGHLYGYPVGEIKHLTDVSGYTEISSAHIEGLDFGTITEIERDMLSEALSNGVML